MFEAHQKLDKILERQSVIEGLLVLLIKQGNKTMSTVSEEMNVLTAKVAANSTVIGSALDLIKGFGAQLAAAGVDPDKLAALSATIDANDAALAAAVAANTPAAAPAPPITQPDPAAPPAAPPAA